MRGPTNPCNDPRSLLIVLPTWVGDFVMATPALRAIRERFNGSHIVFLMEPNLREVVRGGGWMNECVEWPAMKERTPLHRAYRDLVWELRRRRFEWAILFPNSFRAALIARLAGAKRRIGFDRDGRGFLLTNRVPVRNRIGRSGNGLGSLHPPLPKTVRNGAYRPMPIVEYYADLAESIGCERPGDRLELCTSPECDTSIERRIGGPGLLSGAKRSPPVDKPPVAPDRVSRAGTDERRLVVMSPGAKYGAAKCWLPERFAAVADQVIEEQGATVVITCGPGEEALADSIAGAMRRSAVVLHSPLLSLGELKSLIRRADLLICTDSGPRHFAKAFGVPVVTIFGPTHPDWTATSHEAERIVRIDLECSPCQRRTCPLGHHECMRGITVEMVISAARELLGVRRETAAV